MEATPIKKGQATKRKKGVFDKVGRGCDALEVWEDLIENRPNALKPSMRFR